jgi:hypothetical protein
MKQFFKNLAARARQTTRRHGPRALALQSRPTLERLEERMAPSGLFPSGPCYPSNPIR